ncbi:MAG TPA: HlyD family secretion protein [Rhizomicrobium sp.]|nr:HlyD family secretion protein [Rhizomicrobium sp.]
MSELRKPRDALDRWRDEAAKAPSNKAPADKETGRGPQKDSSNKSEDQEREAPRRPRFYQSTWFKLAVGAAVILLIAGGVIWWLDARQYENTDDAFIDTHMVHVAPQIAGQLVLLPVTDNQLVRRGQLLAGINPQDEEARLAQAEAQGAQAQTQLAEALANHSAAQAGAANAAADLARYRSLQKINPQAVAQQQVDQAVAADRNARAQVSAAVAQVANARAQIKTAEAGIATARLGLGYTRITAPMDGHVTQRDVAPGNYVTPGQDLMTIVPLQLWVTANFKETQLARMRPGQPVTLSVDACSGGDIRGHVDSIQRGAGQAFGILPPENATGNYVKVVQRVPVKILLDRVPKDCPLGPGMSVEPSVKVR